MKLKDAFITKQIKDDLVMVSTEKSAFNGIVNANDSAGFIIECLKTDITKDAIVKKMLEVYDAPVDIIAEDIDKVLTALRGIDAIDE